MKTIILSEFITATDIEQIEIPELDLNEIGESAGNFFNGFIEGLKTKFPTILFAAVILIAGFLLAKLVLRIMKRGLKKRKLTGVDLTVNTFLFSLVRIALYIIVLTIVLSMLGVPTNSLVAVIGTAGVAIGLALKDSLANVAGGFILLFTKPFKTGDYIETETAAGTVKAVNILYTELRTFDNKAVYIPNGTVSNATLTNHTKCDTRRLDLIYAVPLSAEFIKAQEIVLRTSAEHGNVLKEPAPQARMLEQTSNSVKITLRVWVATNDYWNVFFDLNEQVRAALQTAGINAPRDGIEIIGSGFIPKENA